MTLTGYPRPLSNGERSVLATVLAVPAPWAPVLRAQIGAAEVIGAWVPTLPSVDLRVGGAAPTAEVAAGPLPVGASVHHGGDLTGELLIWTEHGRLSAIEYAWYTDEAPTELPAPEDIRVTPTAG